MADLIDHANDLAAADLAFRIASATRPKPRGPAQCEDEDCEEAISEHRRDLGARLCVDCQTADELRQAQKLGRGRL